MSRPTFYSGLASEINDYIDHKMANGYAEESFSRILKQFDAFCVQRGITNVSFSSADADAWSEKRQEECSTTHYARVNKVKNFLSYLQLKGYQVYIPPDICFKQTDFQPHIFSDDEIQRYFHAVDAYQSHRNRKRAVQLPVLFRLLYCCGTRINETLGIKKSDVDIDNGIIKLIDTKNYHERYIVLHSEMRKLMQHYADKTFYLMRGNDYIFASYTNKRENGRKIYDIHRQLLDIAGIPYLGEGSGPRLHDWRHTFAVHSFKQMIDTGMDMYVALPILSTYLGHKTIYATERYVRLTMSLYPDIEERIRPAFLAIFDRELTHEETN